MARLGAGTRLRWTATVIAVLGGSTAIAQAGGDGGAPRQANTRPGQAVQIEVRNRSAGETGLVTRSDEYSLRLSNVKVGGGGGAVYGCRSLTAAPEADKACLYADNLHTGEAFLFRSRQGTKVGHFDLGNPAGAPFSTNATGLVANLNADRLDNLHAADIVAQARTKTGLAAQTADTAVFASTANDAQQLGGKDSAAFAERRFAVVDADGAVRAHRGLATTAGVHVATGFYDLKFGRDITVCSITATPGTRNGSLEGRRNANVIKDIGGNVTKISVATEIFSAGDYAPADIAFDVQVLC